MKRNIKNALIVGLAVFALTACEKSINKRDYDYKIDPNNLPKEVVTFDPEVFMTKVRFSGSIDGKLDNFLDYGFIYAPVDTVNKFGSLKEAFIQGAIPSYAGLISTKATNSLTACTDKFQPGKEFICATFALCGDGLALGDELFFVTDSVAYAPLIELATATKENVWKENIGSTFNLSGEGDPWAVATIKYNKRNVTGFQSVGKKGPKTFKRDNYIVFPEKTLGFDMHIAYSIFPTGTTKKGCNNHQYQILISKEPITAENCANAIVLDEHSFVFEGNENDQMEEDDVIQKRIVEIPAEYDYQKVWVAIRHTTDIDKPQGNLFVEEFKLY